MRLSLYVGIVALFWTLSAFILQNETSSKSEEVIRSSVSVEFVRNEVKLAFLHAWHGYRRYAWGSDELCSLTKVMFRQTGHNSIFMGMTIVDSLSTLWIMNLTEEFEEAKSWVRDYLEFDQVDAFSSFFEVSVRVLGGLISAYELSKDEVFLEKAEKIGKMLSEGMNKDGFPYSFYNFHKGNGKMRKSLKFFTSYGLVYSREYYSVSEIGGMLMEFSALAYWTKNPLFYSEKNQSLHRVLENLPKGLKPNKVFSDFSYSPIYSISGESDSFYEYLLKQLIHLPYNSSDLKAEAVDCINDILERLVQQDVSGFYYIGKLQNEKLSPQMDHLTCFFPGLLILAILKLDLKDPDHYLTIAKELSYTCFNMYDQSESGLAPETIYVEYGIRFPWFTENHSALRPETLESLFYLFYYTKDEMYQEWAKKIFKSIEKWAKNEVGYAGVQNVNRNPPTQSGCLPSHFFSGTLKFLYLIFSEPSILDLNTWVLNTEGHPFLIKS